MLNGLKIGLSMLLAFTLLSSTIHPQQAYAASTESVTALFEIDRPMVPEEPETFSTVQEALLKVCEDRGYDEACAKHLLGMVMQESVGKATAVGDQGHAHGWFQIHDLYNPDVKRKCAQDLVCSAEWTLNRLEKKGYGRNTAWNNWAIWCHNGCGINKNYVPNVLRKGKVHWDTPIAIVTAEEHRQLALK